MTWLKYLGAALAAAALFVSGYKYAAALYEADIADLEAQHALALAEKTAELRANESKQMEAVTTAWEEYEKTKAELTKSRANAGNLRIELERVRNLADSYRARLSRAGTDSCKHFAKRLSNCVGLLEEGSGLSEEGASLSQRLSAKHDAVVKIHEAQ